MTSSLLRVICTVCVTLLLARVAYAEDPETRAAKRHFDRGQKLFTLGKFDEALDEYQKAYDASPLPDFLYNIGQCHRNIGDYEQAIFSFKRFLQLDPEAPNREKVEIIIDELEDKLEREGTKKKRVDEPPPPPHAEGSPFYKKWWFWTGIAVVGVAGGVGIYAATRPDGAPDTTLGNIVFTK
ncbi:MAG: tetratricopeptide repeat protein [Polyangiales bacterium]